MRLGTKIGSLGAAGALVLTLAACGGDEGSDADPALRLTSSADALADEPYRIEMTMGDLMSAEGSVDPAAGATEITMNMDMGVMSMDMRIITTPTDAWMDMGEQFRSQLGVDATWMHMDLSRLPEGALNVEPGGDPTNTVDFLQSAADVEQVDDRTFEGVLDLTESAPAMFDDDTISQLGDEATSVSFTATLDDQDRLSTLVITLPQVEELEAAPVPFDALELRFFDYGADVQITEPSADEVQPMPELLYEQFAQM